MKTTVRHHYLPNVMAKIDITITTNLGEDSESVPYALLLTVQINLGRV